MIWLRQFFCGLVGHGWKCWRYKSSGEILGWRCVFCDKFSKTKPSGLLSRHLE